MSKKKHVTGYELVINTDSRVPNSDLPAVPAPKPSKREIIGAMVIRAEQNHEAAREAYLAKERLLEAAIVRYAADAFVVQAQTLASEVRKCRTDEELADWRELTDQQGIYMFPTWDEPGIRFHSYVETATTLPGLKPLMKALSSHSKTKLPYFNNCQVRADITKALDTTNPMRLLEDTESLRQIDLLLARVSAPKQKQLATVDV